MHSSMLRLARLYIKQRAVLCLASALIVYGVFVCLVAPAHAKERNLPTIGEFNALSESEEHIIGRHWLYQSRSRLPILIRLPQMQEYVEQLVYEMVAYSDLPNPALEIILVRDQQMNAFAVPGGVMGIHLGLLMAVDSEDELASVIAHELGHLSQRHYAEVVSQQNANSVFTTGALLAAIGLMFAGLPTHGLATLTAGAAFNAETTLETVRLNEKEADNISFDIMTRSGRDVNAIVNMFERLYKSFGDGQVPLIFRTHPLTQSRISHARAKAQGATVSQYKGKQKRSQLDFYIARSIARIELSTDNESLAAVLHEEIDNSSEDDQRSGLRFGLAYLYQTLEKLDESEKILLDLRKSHPLNIFIDSLLASTELLQGKGEQAEKRLQRLMQITPGNNTLTSTLAVVYIEQEKNSQALELLESMTVTRPGDIWVWIQLEEVYGKLGLIDRTHYARAERRFLLGRYASAKEQFSIASTKTQDKHLKVRVKRRLEEIENLERRIEALL